MGPLKPLALLLALAVAAGPAPARAQASATAPRGWLSALGVGLVALGVGGLGVGVAGVTSHLDAQRVLQAYVPEGGAPAAEDAAMVARLEARAAEGTLLAAVGFGAGGLVLGAAVACLLLDGPAPAATVAFIPTAGGGAATLQLRF